MKTIAKIIEGYQAKTLHGRDIGRLSQFVPEESLALLGLQLKEEFKGKHIPIEFTRENVLKELESDLALSFDKALGQRGLSAGMMYDVIRMWNWILEEGLEDWDRDRYAQYGLPLFKATAVKYGFDNPIGDDLGDEPQYMVEMDYADY